MQNFSLLCQCHARFSFTLISYSLTYYLFVAKNFHLCMYVYVECRTDVYLGFRYTGMYAHCMIRHFLRLQQRTTALTSRSGESSVPIRVSALYLKGRVKHIFFSSDQNWSNFEYSIVLNHNDIALARKSV